MQPLIRPPRTAGIKSVARTISSLASGQVLTGAKWNYRVISSLGGDGTHKSAAFKAEILPKDGDLDAPQWAFIKTATPTDLHARENLERECDTYLLPNIASGTCFRKMYDVIGINTDGGIPCVAFEWLDATLADIPYQHDMRTYTVIKTVVKAGLTSCIVLANSQLVNTDYKPANILLSGTETDDITAKVGDLGLVFPAGSRCSAQPHAMRAPEVWQGQPCTEPSQVWALAATLLCWMKPGILGFWGSPGPIYRESWCIAKLMRLFPSWDIPPIEDDIRRCEFDLAKSFIDEPPTALQQVSCLEDEIRKVDMLPQLRDLLRLMLVVNPDERPSATYVLASKEFSAFEDALAGMK